MLASELATDLQIDQSLMAKRLRLYFAAINLEKPRLLDGQTVERIQHAHELLNTGEASNFKTAIEMVLGTFVEAVPPESVRALEKRLADIETVQARTLDSVNRILQLIEGVATPPDSHGQQFSQ